MTARYPLDGKVVLLTGATGGIGAATAAALVARGARVALVDLDPVALEALAVGLPPGSALAVPGDVTDAARMVEAVDETVAAFGRLDVVFANAGIAYPSTLAAADLTAYERVIEVDLLGVVRTIKPALPHVIANGGHVLVTSSIYAFVNGVINSPYAASKAAVESLGRSLRLELAGEGATAGVLYPGWVRTPMTEVTRGGDAAVTAFKDRVFRGPLGSYVTPEKVAAAAVAGIEGRAARVLVPRFWAPVSIARGAVNAVTDRLLESDRAVHDLIRRVQPGGSATGQSRASAASAAWRPDIPWTPAPGGVADEHR